MADRLVYILALAVVRIIRWLPLAVCYVLGRGVGRFLWLILPGYRRLAKENIERSIGAQLPPGEVAALVREHFATLGANALSAIKIPSLPPEAIDRVATIENLDRIEKNISSGRPVVLAINHIGNWELYAQLVFKVPGVRFGTVYQALHNKLVDDLVNRDRRRLGVETFDRKEGFQAALALLREPGILGVLVDQHAGNSGVWTPFFGRLCSTSPLAATLAIRTGAAVVPVAIHTAGFAKWRVVLSPEIPWTPDNPDGLTLAINKALERQILESPADWFWVHNRWKTPNPNFLLQGAKRGIHLPASEPDPKPFRIMARSPNWLGDAIMSAQAVRAFKAGRPDARVTMACPAKLAEFWKRVGEVDEVLPIEKEQGLLATASQMRGRFDVAILLPNSLRAALEVWLAGVPRRVGYAGHSRGLLLNQIIPVPKKDFPPSHHAERYWRIAARCGAVEAPRESRLWKPNRRTPVIGLCPGAEYGPAKRWPAYKFKMLIQQVSEKMNCQWVVVGTASDTPIAREIAFGASNVTDMTGQTSLSGLMDLLQTLSGLVTNDTGTMHLADFIGTPVAAIFGSTEPSLTGPRGPRSEVIRRKAECSPCLLRVCPLDFRCMEDIPVELVVEAVLGFRATKRR